MPDVFTCPGSELMIGHTSLRHQILDDGSLLQLLGAEEPHPLIVTHPLKQERWWGIVRFLIQQ